MCLVRESFSCWSMYAKYTLYLPLSMSLASFPSMRNHIQSASLLPFSSSSCASSSLPCCAAGFYPLCSAPIGCTAHHRCTGCLPAIGCLVSLTPSCLYCPCLCQIGYSFFPLYFLAGLLLLASVSLVIIFLLLHSSVHAPSEAVTSFSAANLMQAVYMQVPVDTLFQDNF